MEQIKATLPDGRVLEVEKGTDFGQLAAQIGRSLAKAAIAGKKNGELVDLSTPLSEDSQVEIVTLDSPEGREIYRHSSAHILAQAMQELYPGTKLGIGPAIENGFYYDFDVEIPLSSETLDKIEKRMQEIIQQDLPFTCETMDKEAAKKLFQARGESYKIELIEDLPGEIVSIYRQGDFVDLCRGPHLPSTGKLKAYKLLSLAGAYWRGDEKRPMLQRIYGTAFPKKAELDDYLHRLEEAKKRDHRKLGKELDLFSIQEEGPGFPFFHPKGMILRNLLEDFWRVEHRKRGYQEIKTPIILNEQLWHTSGHWDHYKENMYFTKIDQEDYAVKPMNCPGSMLVYKRKIHSYRDLPLRMGELGLVHRHELSGALHGLMRVRCFTQDDAHLFLLPEQVKPEIMEMMDFIDYIYNVFGFKYHVELSTRPEKSMGTDEQWELATNSLRDALEAKAVKYIVNEGDGAFYGPKIDFHLQDCIGRTWQCGTIQLDFQMPERFDLTYIGPDGEKHRPVMIHRTFFGSVERFIGILTEHYAGAFPVWLSPVQVKILPITDRANEYAEQLKARLEKQDVRVELDLRNEKIGYKIREAQMEKLPYMLVIGDKEVENNQVAIRKRGDGDLGAVSIEQFEKQILTEIAEKK